MHFYSKIQEMLIEVCYAQARSSMERSGSCFTNADDLGIFTDDLASYQPTGSIGTAIDKAGLWQQPRIVGKLLVVGPLLNFFYNFRC